ncbi:MAG TPA: MarR family winged helix-turn-helix transcriptional regulator [Caulobacteraceae bacterium]|nr:MarR family winged helix-turn-helix transcriptional regulator [Caulobacteraceae bacterium]
MRFLENAPDPAGEFPADVPDYVLYLAFQVTRRRDLLFDAALAPSGLSLNRWRSLSVIRRLGECTMKSLARYTTIDRTTLTRSVDQLVLDGLVERGGSAADRRKVMLKLTPRGEEVFLESSLRLSDANRRAFEGIPDDVGRVLARGFQSILRNLVEDPELAEDLIQIAPIDERG